MTNEELEKEIRSTVDSVLEESEVQKDISCTHEGYPIWLHLIPCFVVVLVVLTAMGPIIKDIILAILQHYGM